MSPYILRFLGTLFCVVFISCNAFHIACASAVDVRKVFDIDIDLKGCFNICGHLSSLCGILVVLDSFLFAVGTMMVLLLSVFY